MKDVVVVGAYLVRELLGEGEPASLGLVQHPLQGRVRKPRLLVAAADIAMDAWEPHLPDVAVADLGP